MLINPELFFARVGVCWNGRVAVVLEHFRYPLAVCADPLPGFESVSARFSVAAEMQDANIVHVTRRRRIGEKRSLKVVLEVAVRSYSGRKKPQRQKALIGECKIVAIPFGQLRQQGKVLPAPELLR